MPSKPWPEAPGLLRRAATGASSRRAFLSAGLAGSLAWGLGEAAAAPAQGGMAAEQSAQALLRTGGVVVALRHALAPGTFDPPGLTLGDCRTQRNLNEAGREQARRIGAWFQRLRLQPAVVRSSPWCRCQDTARLAFGEIQVWDALGSPHGSSDSQRRLQRDALVQGLRTVPGGRFEVWVTHAFVQSKLARQSTGSGEALILRADANGQPELLAPLTGLAG